MPRNITVTFGDGSSHVYQNAPDTLTPQDVAARAASDFAGKPITNIDGGNAAPPAAAPAPSLMDSVMGSVKSAASTVADVASGYADSAVKALTTLGHGLDMGDAATTGTPMPPPVAPPPPDIDALSAPFQTPDNQKSPAQITSEKAIASQPPPTSAVGIDQTAARRRAWDDVPQGTLRAGYNEAAGGAGKTLGNAMTTAGEAIDSEDLRTTGRQYQAAADARINRAMQGNEDSDAVKTVAGVFSLAPMLAGTPGIASMVTQAGVDGYSDARRAGDSPGEAVSRGTAMALANYVGLRTQLPGLTGALTKAVSGAPAGEAVAALGHALTTNVSGMEATTVLGDLYDKMAPGGLKSDMTADDMVHDIAATAKSATLLTLAVPGLPLAASHLFHAAHALAHGQGSADVASAIGSATPPAADATPTTSTDNTAAAPPAPDFSAPVGLDTLHNSIDEAARTVGLTPKATAALRDAATQQDPQNAAAFVARAFHRFEANGLTTKPGAPGAFRDALAQRIADQQPDEPPAPPAPAPAPAVAAAPSVADQLTAIRPLDAAPAPDAAPAAGQQDEAQPAPITPTAMAQANDIAAAAHDAATSPFNDRTDPTDAQKAAGNYAMGHVQLHGLDISIENPQGSTRSGVDPDGNPWSNEMVAHYGYIKGTHAADGDHVDTFIGPNPEAQTAYVIDQVDPGTGKFDEPKTILGADSEAQARELYAANYADGWNGLGAITPLPMDAFKAWVRDGVKDKPLGDITQWKPTDERAQPDVAEPAGVPVGAGDGGGGPAVAGGGDSRPDAAVATGRDVGGNAAAPDAGAGTPVAVGGGNAPDAALTPAPRLLGKPVTDYETPALQRIAAMKTTSQRARDVAGAEIARRAAPPSPEMQPQPAQQQQAGRAGPTGAAKHPATVAGSRLLALVSKNLGGLDPAWLGEFSSKQETKRLGADGRPITQWKNPLIPGVGKLFRRGGTQDLESIANMLEEHHYLPPGTVERDPHAAGQQAQDIVRAALNRAEPKTMDEQEADDEASRNAQADAHYAALDAQSARDAESERQAMFEAHNIDPSAFDRLMTDEDVARGVPDISDRQALADFLGLTPEELDYEQKSQGVAGEGGAGAEAGGDAAEGSRPADEAGKPAPRPAAEGSDEGLTLAAQTSADLKAKAARESAARTADAAEQKRLADKAKADAQVGDFKLTGSDRDADEAAANGQQPLLSQHAEEATGTPEFKKWFGDSKVVDADGQPKVVYHGTNKTEDGEAFSVFDAYAADHGLFGQGSYFTEDPKIASDYTTKGKGASPTVYPVYLSIKHPIDMDKNVTRELPAWEKAFPDVDFTNAERAPGNGETYTNEDFFRIVEDHLRDERLPKWEGAEIMQEGLRSMGYDGVTHIGGGRVKGDGTKHRVYIAFDPEQVKSATGNRGTFDSTSADIRTKQSGEPVRKGIDPAVLRAEVARIQTGWKDAPPVHVVDDVNDLPFHIQDSLRSMGATGKTRALLMPGRGSDPGDVYLIASRLKDLPAAQAALFHEVLGHYGIRKVLGSDAVYSAEMYKLRQANPALASEAEAWMQAHGRGAIAARMERGLSMDQAMKAVRALSTEEALADRAGRGEPIRGLQSLMAKIQAWLRSVGLHSVADHLESMTQAETAALLAHARSTVEATEPSSYHGDELAPALSEADDKAAPLLSQHATDDETPEEQAPAGHAAAALARVRDAGANFADTMKAIRDDALLKTVPMALGTPETRTIAKDFANADRLARWQWGKFDDVLKKNYDEAQRRAMWEAGDEESVLRQQGKTPGPNEGLNRLTPDERKTVETLQTYGDSLLKRAQDVGMFQGEGLPSWTPRMAVLVDGKGEFSRPKGGGAETGAKQGRNIVTSASSLKARKYLTAEDTEAAMKGKLGDGAQLVRDIRTMPLAMARLERAIAGRELVNNIKAMGQRAGLETVSNTDEPGFFTVDHPAFKTWQATTGEDGTKSWEAKPLYVNKAFQGPLKAVMSETPGPVYSALMALKAKSMGLIMYSPLIHNAVEWGRALPAMPGKVATFQIYFEGNRIKNDPAQMRQAISDGLVPIGKRGGIQDITGIMEDPSLKPGRSWTAKLIGGALGVANEKAGVMAKKGIDAAGDIWHNTLLWDRVGDLQAGLYGALREKEIQKGTDPAAAGKLAAHFANRFAGALPNEAMSAGARKVANIMMFSRTFTLGNLGLMKDMVTGLPRDIQSQIRTASGDLAAAAATSRARRIAIASFIVDIGLMYVGNSILQSTIEHMKGKKSWGEVGQGYLDRLHKLLQRTGDHPLETLSNPFDMANSLSSTSANEPGKEDRVRVGTQDDGTAIYLRLPTGKVGEDFKNWITKPLVTAKAKESQLVRPLQMIWNNDNGIGQRIYDPDAKGIGGVLSNAGKIAKLFATQAIPADAIQGALDWKNGKASDVDKLKVAGPLAGLTFSKGAPGGPAVGQMYDADRRFEGAKMDVMPDVRAAIKAGDDDKAIALLEGIKMTPSEIMRTLRHLEMPESRLSAGAFKHFSQHASDDDMERMNDLLGAEKAREAAPAQP